jgi:hypothetical protein
MGRLGHQAAFILDALEESEDTLAISVVSLMAVMYLAEKNHVNLNLTAALDLIDSSAKYLPSTNSS